MSTDPSWTPIVGVAVSALVAIGGLVKWIIGAFQKRDVKIAELEKTLAVQQGKTELLINTIAASEARMATALEGVRSDISGMTLRLDRLIEAIALDRQVQK